MIYTGLAIVGLWDKHETVSLSLYRKMGLTMVHLALLKIKSLTYLPEIAGEFNSLRISPEF